MRSSSATTLGDALQSAEQQLVFALEDAVDMLLLVRSLAHKEPSNLDCGAAMGEGLEAFEKVLEKHPRGAGTHRVRSRRAVKGGRPDVRCEHVWLERDPATGARIELAPASEPYALAEAVSKMVSKVRNPVRLAKTVGLCSCGDCLSCDIQAMRARRATETAHG